MDSVESQILGRLRKMDVREEILRGLKTGLKAGMTNYLQYQSQMEQILAPRAMERKVCLKTSVLQILEQSVGENDEFAGILRMVRDEVHAKGIGENDFKTIAEEITKQYESWQRSRTGN